MLHITLLPNPLPPWVKITAFSNIFISEDGFLGNGLSSPPVRNSCWLVAFPRPYKTSLCKQRKSSLKWWAVLLVNGQTTMTLAHRMVEGFFLSLFPECLSSFLIIFCLSLLFRSSLLLPSFFPFFFLLGMKAYEGNDPNTREDECQDEWQQQRLPCLAETSHCTTQDELFRQYMLTSPSTPVVL